jgi:hypothetical protein
MPSTPTMNPLPAAPVVPAPPANGSLAYREGRFYQVNAPQPPHTNFRLVEISLGGLTIQPRVLRIDPAGLSAAIARGEVTILPKSTPVSVAPPRPYPFEAARVAAMARRARFWRRRDVADLRRRGLLMTCADYERLLADREPAVPPSDAERRDA